MSVDPLIGALTRLPRNTLRIVRVTVKVASPLAVQLPDGTQVNALGITGLTYTAGGAGIALLSEGSIPVVLPTT